MQYNGLMKLREKYYDDGFRILALPSRQFAEIPKEKAYETLLHLKQKNIEFDLFMAQVRTFDVKFADFSKIGEIIILIIFYLEIREMSMVYTLFPCLNSLKRDRLTYARTLLWEDLANFWLTEAESMSILM